MTVCIRGECLIVPRAHTLPDISGILRCQAPDGLLSLHIRLQSCTACLILSVAGIHHTSGRGNGMQFALTGEVLLNYVEQSLVPHLKKGDITIMDNLRVHKVNGVQQTIEQADAHVLYLPLYSPDFNPIEMLWSKLKFVLRALKIRNINTLWEAIPFIFDAVSLADIASWFQKAGYSLT